MLLAIPHIVLREPPEQPGIGADQAVRVDRDLPVGDDAGAKQVVAGLAKAGFEPVDAGPLTQARLLEPLAMLWISMAYAYGQGTNIAFKLLRK